MNKQVMAYIANKKAEATKQSEATKKQSKFPRTVGFWKNEHGRLLSSPLKKSDIPSHTRLMLLQNRRKKKGDNYPDVKSAELHKIDNISDDERRNKKDYTLIASDNLELIKREIYQ